MLSFEDVIQQSRFGLIYYYQPEAIFQCEWSANDIYLLIRINFLANSFTFCYLPVSSEWKISSDKYY
jgi:hypothetical protein